MLQTKALTVVDQETLKEIWKLEEVLKQQGTPMGVLSLDGSLNCNPQMPYLYLLYEEGSLKSLLSLFTPTWREAEIYGCTHPESRRKGYFKTLVKQAEEELIKNGTPEILFICESHSIEGKAVTEKLGGILSHTEYSLRYYPVYENTPANGRLLLQKAEPQDFGQLVEISCLIFEDSREEAEQYIRGTMESNIRQQYKAMLDGRIIGIGGVSRKEGEASIFGFGILPDYQGKGFGKEMLQRMVYSIRMEQEGGITLEVNSTNERAFRLYTSEGFRVESAYGYYRKKIL